MYGNQMYQQVPQGRPSKTLFFDNVLTQLFGVSYKQNSVKIPDEETLPDRIRHFDATGLSMLDLKTQVLQASAGSTMGMASVSFYHCPNCGKAYYRINSYEILT